MAEPIKLLTIAGSDSGGAAGLQADLRTWTAVQAHGMSAITAVTAQNSQAVTGVQFMSPDFLAAQLEAVLSDYGAVGAKTGFVGRAELIPVIADKLKKYRVPNIVIDPVITNYKGESMFPQVVTDGYLTQLFPLATIITPNRHEAGLLTGLPVTTVAEMETAVLVLHQHGCQNVLIKRGEADGQIVDVLFDGQNITHFYSPQIETKNTHGTGDTLSALICARLAVGDDVKTAVTIAHQLTHQAIKTAVHWQLGSGKGPIASHMISPEFKMLSKLGK